MAGDPEEDELNDIFDEEETEAELLQRYESFSNDPESTQVWALVNAGDLESLQNVLEKNRGLH